MLLKQDPTKIGKASIADLNADPLIRWQHTNYLLSVPSILTFKHYSHYLFVTLYIILHSIIHHFSYFIIITIMNITITITIIVLTLITAVLHRSWASCSLCSWQGLAGVTGL